MSTSSSKSHVHEVLKSVLEKNIADQVGFTSGPELGFTSGPELSFTSGPEL